MISESEREKLKEETKKLLDEFSKTLASVKSSESNVERESFEREEKEGKDLDKTFREIMFENAPQKSEDFIIAEKKTW
jgi:hypothetical protein